MLVLVHVIHCAQFIVVMCIILLCTQCTVARVHDKVAARRQPGVRCEVLWRWSAAAVPRPGHPQSAGIDFVLARTVQQHGAGRSWAQPAAAGAGAAEAEHNIRPEAAPPSAEQVSSEQARAWHSGTHQGANCDPVYCKTHNQNYQVVIPDPIV